MIQSQERGATIYAEFLGGSFTCDAYHMTEPHPEGKEMFEAIINTFFVKDAVKFLLNVLIVFSSGAGLSLCIEKALAQAGVCKEDVNYVNAHATSTRAGDLQEYKALIRAFGKNPEVSFFTFVMLDVGHFSQLPSLFYLICLWFIS